MKKQFKAESKKLLDMMIHSIYTNQEIFLRELISNASDALDKLYYKSLTDTKIKIKKEDLEIRLIPDKENRTLTIKDNGIGMTKEELDKVGQMFFTTKKKGTGLGTCLSKEIIKLHDGNITYSSKKNEWTEVNITLPKGEVMS